MNDEHDAAAAAAEVDRRFLLGGLAGAAGFAALAGMTRTACAGPLNPPAGPVISTGKTVAETEPRTAVNAANTPGDGSSLFRITQPGSYYLTGNITGVAGKHGISVEAAGVAIDLNGFSLNGVPGALDGVRCPVVAGVVNISVVNGTISGWPGYAVELFQAISCYFRDLQVRNSGALRIGSVSIAQRCAVFQGHGDGVHAGSYSVVEGCVVFGKAGTGIVLMNSCAARGCQVSQCAGSGISGQQYSRVEQCNVTYNNTGGAAGGGGIVIDGQGTCVVECSAGNNTGHGIAVGERCSVTRCQSSWNSGSGIVGTSYVSVVECDAFRNALHGIDVTSGLVLRCHSSSNNSTAGVSTGIRTNNGGRVDGCYSVGNVKGYESQTATLLVNNMAQGNGTNFVIATTNGGLFTGYSGFVAPVNGNNGGTAPSAGDPRANIAM